ncbi:MAG: RNA polymerase sigma factor [Streptosporangiaceae bacterium]|nr:RNA polymerase sigma factor [Streptosporangiaceae bacterium]MBV9855712.1 RNA polymerase sigma factor [Streptosporangiaceae bacterium]
MMPDSDAVAIEASWRDPERFSVLFDRHAPAIHRYLARRVGEAADDLLAETFLVAFGKRRGYDPGYRDARPWLYGIATNLVGQHRRDEVRRYRLQAAAGPPVDLPDYAERIVASVTAQSIRSQLAEALAAIPGGDRDVLLLVAWEDLSYDEVARALAIPVGTVRSRLHRARARLRQSLTGTGAAATYKEILANE